MLNVKSSRSILGTPFYLFVLPIIMVARFKLARREPLVKNVDPGDIRDEWTAFLWCFDCKEDVMHNFIEFRDEPVVESECRQCKVIRVHEDGVV